MLYRPCEFQIAASLQLYNNIALLQYIFDVSDSASLQLISVFIYCNVIFFVKTEVVILLLSEKHKQLIGFIIEMHCIGN